MNDAELSDIYVDPDGKLWRCIATCSEPTVSFEAVEGYVQQPSNNLMGVGGQAIGGMIIQPQAAIIKTKKTGGVSGAMWNGWKRIFRPEPAPH
ncbi:hypothetical protein IVA94_14995 [Bradyrhizobium sp. 156]|uniref:hypothetical protein n=1 Tax=Bradyrhizobium sp. 156 TaxID=2782630 RepID=UPI001FFB2135|nr:hypothetical protein [Bradyrhizobium sp. 156]MCK1322176.1 hypothetical protein [Bradyrhizobium sp. 156]